MTQRRLIAVSASGALMLAFLVAVATRDRSVGKRPTETGQSSLAPVLKAVSRVARPGRVRVGRSDANGQTSVHVLADGPGRFFDPGKGARPEDVSALIDRGFQRPPPPVLRTMSIYRSLAKRALQAQTSRDAEFVVLLCPKSEWEQAVKDIAIQWEPAPPEDSAGRRPARPTQNPRVGPKLKPPKLTIDDVTVVAPADPGSVPKYGKVELWVTLSNVAATLPYEPDPGRGGLDLQAEFTSPSSDVTQVNGFYDGSAWRIRFAPGQVGAWSYAVTAEDSSGLSNTVSGGLTCVVSSSPGWARLDGFYLRFTEGQTFFAVGHNTGWQPDVAQPSLTEMASRGETLLSFWIAMPWAEPGWASPSEPYWDDRAPIENVEQGLGNYNQAACTYIDNLVEAAEAAGVYLLPTLWSHGQLRDTGHPWGSGWWYNNAYSSVCSATQFFELTDGGADTEQWRYQKNFYRYLIARWGYCRAVAAWVALCEIEGTNGYLADATQAEAWCDAVRSYFAQNDPYRRNASDAYPIAVSISDQPSWDSGLDLRSVDCYERKTDDVEVAASIAGQTGTMRGFGTACFHGEFGGDVLSGASQPAHLHNGIWAGLASGAAMTPLVWCDDGNFPMLTPTMQDQLQYLSQFVSRLDCLGEANLVSATVSVSDAACRGWGMRLDDRGFAWIQRTSGTLGGEALTVSTLTPGDYRLEWYDVWSHGDIPFFTDAVTVGANGLLTASIPALARSDAACTFVAGTAPILGIGVDTSTWAIGTLPAGETVVKDTAIGVTNTGNIAEDITLQQTGPAAWTPGTSRDDVGTDQYVLGARLQDSLPLSGDFVDSDVVTTTPQRCTAERFGTGGRNIPPGDSENLWPMFRAPTSSTSTSQQSIILHIGCVAH